MERPASGMEVCLHVCLEPFALLAVDRRGRWLQVPTLQFPAVADRRLIRDDAVLGGLSRVGFMWTELRDRRQAIDVGECVAAPDKFLSPGLNGSQASTPDFLVDKASPEAESAAEAIDAVNVGRRYDGLDAEAHLGSR